MTDAAWTFAAGGALASLALSGSFFGWWHARTSRRLGTVASLLASYRDGDFSTRARTDKRTRDGALAPVLEELNRLGDTLRTQRLGAMEAWSLLRKVMAELDAVVLTFDDQGRVTLANDAAARAFGQPSSALIGATAKTLGIDDLLDIPATGATVVRVDSLAGDGAGTWELRRGQFRLSGEPHTLLVLSDLRGPLRAQERDAWKRLVRVMGHEINNSLAPIQSIAENLQTIFGRSPRADDWEDDVASGLSIVARRAEALARFTGGYAKLARIPPPRLARVEVATWVQRIVQLEQRLAIEVVPSPDMAIAGDADQLDQLLINLAKNAVDASLEKSTKGHVRIRWQVRGDSCALIVEDDGPGISDGGNLFVPFFTTKPNGSGIGLALSREIAEGHGGDVTLRSRLSGDPNEPARGAEAEVRLRLWKE